ncbi:MAG: hypothetical protein ACKOAX_03885, partial [Candidatus Kapaibacterium sp.]
MPLMGCCSAMVAAAAATDKVLACALMCSSCRSRCTMARFMDFSASVQMSRMYDIASIGYAPTDVSALSIT